MRSLLQKLPFPVRNGPVLLSMGERGHFAGAIVLVAAAWLGACHLLKPAGHYHLITIMTGFALLIVAVLLTERYAGELPGKGKWALGALLAVKMIVAVAYFAHFFVIRESGDFGIAAYGDSHLHHRAAIEFLGRWEKYGVSLGLDPGNPAGYEPSYVTSMGYAGLLALVYASTGIVPEAAIVLNVFLGFVFCLLAYRLFVVAGLPSRTAMTGLWLLLFCPALWLWSALLYKESLLFLVVAAGALAAFRLIAEFGWRRLLFTILLLVLLLTLRFPFVAPLLALLLFGPFYLSESAAGKKRGALLVGAGVLAALLLLQANYNLINSTTPILDTVKTVMNLPPSGGQFMTHGLGSIAPNFSNFWYTLPVRAVYILMIPMPWFGGGSAVERVDYLVSHLDALYDITLFMALLIMLVRRRQILVTRGQTMLLLVGMMYFLIPLFFFFPSRR